jgi:Glycosyltransferase family 87
VAGRSLGRVVFVGLVVAVVEVMVAFYLAFGDDHGDIGVYHNYAIAFFQSVPRHLPTEYPALALAPFSITLFPAGDYGVPYVLAMTVLVLGSMLVVALTTSRATATAYAVYMVLAGPWTLFGRYDLVVSLVVLLAVVAAGRGRWTIAYVLLALGVLLKLYPLFLLPVFAIEQWRADRDARRSAVGLTVFAGIVGAGVSLAAAIDFHGLTSPIRYALQRPVESESVPATVLWILSGFSSPGRLEHSFGSANVISGASGLVGAVSLLALLAGLAGIYALALTGRLRLRQACLACVLVVIVTNRVFSAQYVMWLLPLVAFEIGLDPLWIAICLLSFLVYPVMFEVTGLADAMPATAYSPAFLVVVAARNALLLVATWRLLRSPVARPAMAPA